MRTEIIRDLVKARPFKPFTLFTPDGKAIHVWHPDFGLLSPDGRTLFVYQKDFAFNMIDVMLITRVEFSPPDEQRQAETEQSGAA